MPSSTRTRKCRRAWRNGVRPPVVADAMAVPTHARERHGTMDACGSRAQGRSERAYPVANGAAPTAVGMNDDRRAGRWPASPGASKRCTVGHGCTGTRWRAGAAAQPVAAGAGSSATGYRRHRPEKTVLYQVVEANAEAFFAHLDEHESGLPRFVREEFEAYLGCGRLERGFVRAKCTAMPPRVSGGLGMLFILRLLCTS